MDVAEKVLREVEESAEKIRKEREAMRPRRELLRLLDKSDALTKSQRSRMVEALGETPGRKAEPKKPARTGQRSKQSGTKPGDWAKNAKKRSQEDEANPSRKAQVVASLKKLDTSTDTPPGVTK